ncbi:MAG TPA: ABC transporter substrate-binding protein [Cytophagales bacterium]|nr:ABC transporter substrate-binding protein [Cytophagales bacterium]HAA17732.1 ABC transporter substrate-binding protein [Cytophagales bacterium]HAP58033.1 ABC transporter substrate-binding protein [Cytophagales bacterium]
MRATGIGWVAIGIAFYACKPTTSQPDISSEEIHSATVSSFTPEVKYAQHFTVGSFEEYKTLIVNDPWEVGDTLVSYVLYPKGLPAPEADWADFIVPIPIEEVVATSSPQIGLIGLIDELDKLTGVAEDRYVYNRQVYERIGTGEIAQVGSLKDSNLEVLLDLSPDLVMKTGVDNVRNEDFHLNAAGIPISYNVEWMESSMLARAEWIKFTGAFFDKDQETDSIFRYVEQEYLHAIELVAAVEDRPSIMTGNNFKGTWYMPAADSYMTKLILDAGGEYRFKDEQSTGSLPLSFEVVLDEMVEADFWIGPRAGSLKELEMMDERYLLFSAFKKGNVYTFNKRMSDNGGNDYWETGMTRPDRILKDVIKIFHPELLPQHELYYFKKLQ